MRLFLVVAWLLGSASSNWLQGLGRALGRLRPGQRRQQARGRAEDTALGLRNLGNTCYLNSVLQGLFHVRAFRDGVLDADFAQASAGSELQQVFRDLTAGGHSAAVDTFGLVQSLGINTAIQEDAQEFYLRLLNAVDGDVKAAKVSQVFAGETEQTITCRSVAFESRKKQRFLDLSLDASRADDVEQSLQQLFSEKEAIEGYRTPQHGKQDAERTLHLSAVPRALCLHLKRFHFDAALMSITKVGRRLAFPFTLDLASLISPSSSSHSGAAGYNLAAVVVHEGTATAGHYVCYARPDPARAPQRWLKLDDHSASSVSEDAVRDAAFGDAGGGGGGGGALARGGASRNAYMLFYTRAE